MSTSSADPAELARYATASAEMTAALQRRLAALAATHDAVVPRLQWGVFDLSATFTDLARHVQLDLVDDAWVASVSRAFSRADGGPGPRPLPDAVLGRALDTDGVPRGARTHITVDDALMAGMPPTSGYADDPVCTATGHFLEVELDLPLPWRAGPLAWLRTYTSRWLRPGPFGRGWASWASVGATRVGDGAVEVVLHDGRRAVFLAEPGGGWGRVAGLPAALTDREPGGWELRFSNGDTWQLDAAGVLLEVRSGVDVVALVRGEGGRLDRLDHSSGRRLDLDWAGDRVVRLRSSDGREVAFGYDADGDLVRAVRPGDVVRGYEQAGGGLIGAVVDADGVVECRNTYDGEGRVLTQRSPHGRTTRFTYASPGLTVVDDADGGPVATYVHDPAGRLVGVVDDHGLRQATRYDQWGSPTAVTDRTGATTLTLHDEWGRVLAVERPDGRRTSVRYDDLGRIVERAAPDGGVVRLSHAGHGRWPETVVDPLGAVTTLETADGEVVSVRDPDGVTTRFDRDADGLVVAVQDATGARTLLERAPDGEVVAVVDPDGVRAQVERDAAGRVVRRLLPDGVALALSWSTAGRLTAAVGGDGARTAFTWGADGELAGLTDPTGSTLVFEHDRHGRLSRVRDGADGVVEHEFDGLGRLVALVDPTGARWTREHDAEGRVTALVDPEGRRQERENDDAGRLVQVDEGAGAVTRFGYDAGGRLAEVVAPDGGTIRTLHDLAGRAVAVTGPDGATWRYAWSPAGRLLSSTSPAGRRTVLEHDAAGRVQAVVGPDGARRSVERDTAGRVVASTGPGGERVVLEHDEAGRVVALVGGGGSRVQRTFDDAGRLVAATTADGSRTSWSYDPAGRLTGVVDALGGASSFAYDPVGALIAATDPTGARSTYRHDAAGRPTGWTGPDRRPVDLALDRSGRLAARTDEGGTLALERDAAGRVVGWTDPAGRRVEVDLDPAGRLLSVREPGRTTTRSYDATGKLVQDGPLAAEHDPDGLRTALSGPGDERTASTRDAAGRVVALSGPAGDARLRRDAAGRPERLDAPGLVRHWARSGGLLRVYLEEADGANGALLEHDAQGRTVVVGTAGGTARLRYDAAGQLVGQDGTDGHRTWTWQAGRRTSATGPTGTTTYEHDTAGRLLRAVGPAGTTAYEHDAAGRRTREVHPDGRVRTYSWDALGRLRAVDDDGTVTALDVDALGDLVGVDGVPLLWDHGRPVPALRRVGDLPVTGEDTPLAVGEDWRRTDAWGSVRGLDVWGQGLAEQVAGRVGLGLRGEVVVAGLVWLRGRVYDPATGIFLSPDPLPPALGGPTVAAPYAYAGGAPLDASDPLGLTPMTDADLQAYRDDVERGLLDRAGDEAAAFALDPVQWVQDHGDALLAAGLIVVGGVLVATGVGAPIGAGILIGATASIAGQIAVTGRVDARSVWVSAAAGGISGGVGGLFSTSSVAVQVAAGAGADAATSAAGQLLTTGHVSPGALAGDTALGGVGGGVGGLLSRAHPAAAGALPDMLPRAMGDAPDTHATTFFPAAYATFYKVPDATVGAPGGLSWVMPRSEALGLLDHADIVRATGNAPAVAAAARSHGDLYALDFPVEGMGARLPTTADATDSDGVVYEHFRPGGHTAVRQPDGSYVVNGDIHEYVVPGGQPVPDGSVLVRIDSDGVRHAVRSWPDPPPDPAGP